MELPRILLHCIQLSKQVTVQIQGVENRPPPDRNCCQVTWLRAWIQRGMKDCGHLCYSLPVPSTHETLSSGDKKHKSGLQGVLRQMGTIRREQAVKILLD